jgi:hypothetical protein
VFLGEDTGRTSAGGNDDIVEEQTTLPDELF